MANPFPPGIPPTFWADYQNRLEADLAEAKKSLEPLEAGQMRWGQRTGDGPWRDITEEWIARYKHTIGNLEAILAAVAKRELP
jgi:hypothetical protein